MVEKYTLKNGIPVFIVENHSAPVVSVQAWVSRGSCHEKEAEAGISHFLEHALFKGTKKRKVGQIALEIETRGGEINAFTSFEETAYYTTLASRFFEEGLDIISDAVQNPSFDAHEMAREKEVILEEIRRAHDSTFKMVSMNLWQTCFSGTPLGRPVLGFNKTVSRIDHEKLRRYFSDNYHAGSMSVFIVGDVDPVKALAIVKKKFERVRSRPQKALPKRIEGTKHRHVQLVSLSRDMGECQLQIGWPGPEVTHESIPPLDLLCSALGSGESSRLYQRLVKEKQLALEVQMGLSGTSRCSLAVVTMVTVPEKLEAAIEEFVNILKETAELGLKESEIERVKSSLEADVVSGKETVDGYARRLGYHYIQFGDPEYEKKYLDIILGTDLSDVNAAFKHFFEIKPVMSLAHPTQFKPNTAKLKQSLEFAKARTQLQLTEKQKPLRTQKGTLTFISKSVSTLPIISLKILFPGGAREESNTEWGLANLFQRVWTSGTPSYNSLQIAHTLESIGAAIHGFAGRHTLGLSVDLLSKHWPIVKPLLKEILAQPAFPENEIQTEKHLISREIITEKDSPGALCNFNFLNALYGDHVYGRSALGKQQTVANLSRQHVLDFYKGYVHRKNAVISSVGCFDTQDWQQEISSVLSTIPESGLVPKPFKTLSRSNSAQIIAAEKQPLHQSHILVGFMGSALGSKDRYALKLLSSCLAGQGGRLFLELRDKQSLAYQVSPIQSDSPEGGVFAFYIGCAPDKWSKSLSGIRAEVEKVIEKPMSAKELARAKQYWVGRFELDMQRYGSQAMVFGLDEVYGLGYDHALKVSDLVRSISNEDIRLAAERYLTLDTPTISIVHPTKLTLDEIEKTWSQPNG